MVKISDYSRRKFLKIAGMGASVLAIPQLLKAGKKPDRQLNFVFILIDDLGWADFGCYGSTFYETPNIDKLASEGMRFTDAYASSPVCSPTRASIMSGKHPGRINITQWIGGAEEFETEYKGNIKLIPPDYDHQLALEEVTLAEAFKEAGYSTCFAGKWHLCDNSTGQNYYPQKQGFDINRGGCHWGQPWGSNGYFSPYENSQLTDGPTGEYLTDRLTDESLSFIEDNTNNPFLLYLSHYAVHTPIQGKSAIVEKYETKADSLPAHDRWEYVNGIKTCTYQDHTKYAAMIESVDEGIGRIVAKLKELGIEDNTAIIITSDNGGLSTYADSLLITSNLPLRYGKGWCYEGGIREPLIIKWPGQIQPGSTCSEPVTSCDFYPTMLEMAGLPLKPEQHLDGVSLVPLLKQTGSINREALYWHYPHYHGAGHKPSGAIRAGDYKLIEFLEDNHVELYNLKDDIGEMNDLSIEMPAKVNELRNKLYTWRERVDARMPKDWQTPVNTNNSVVPTGLELNVKYPTSSKSSLLLSYKLPRSSRVELNIYDPTGKKVRTLINKYQTSGAKTLVWNGKDDRGKTLTSGTYIFKMEAVDRKKNMKMLLLK